MSTLVHDDTLFAAQAGRPPSDEAKTVIGRCPENPLTKVRPAPEPDVGERPIAKLILSHERPITRTPSSLATSRSAAAERARGLPITVLTKDESFGAQMRAALNGDHDVLVVDNIEAAAERAAAHQCPILVTDTAITRSSLDELSKRVHTHDRDVTIIASSSRDQGGLLIGLQSSGAIDGFLLKPVTTAAAELVIEAATRRHRTQTSTGSVTRLRAHTRPPRTHRTDYTSETALATQTVVVDRKPQRPDPVTPSQSTPKPNRVSLPRASWPIVVAIALAVGGIAWWTASQRQPRFDPNELIEKHLALAEQAKLAGRWLDPRDGAIHHYQAVLAIDAQNVSAQRGLDRVAGELSKEVQAHMSAQRFSDAALTLSRLRELQPDYPELPLLDDQLRELQAAIVAAATPIPQAPAAVPPITQRTKPIERAQREKPVAAPKKSKPVMDESPSAAAAMPKLQEPTTVPIAEPVVLPPAPVAMPPTPSQSTPAKRTLLTYVQPVYPREAFMRGLEGSVTVSMQITDDGTVVDPRVESGEKRQLFGRAALAAVRQWRYAPRSAASPPGNERVTVKLEFKLHER